MKATHLHGVLVELLRQLTQLRPRLAGAGEFLQPVQLLHFGNRVRLLLQDLYDLEAAQARDQQGVVGLRPVTTHDLNCERGRPDPATHTHTHGVGITSVPSASTETAAFSETLVKKQRMLLV